jgi:translation initiation factor 1
MSKKGKSNTTSHYSSPLVYSTNPTYRIPKEEASTITLAPAEQALSIILETKHRAGKTVTIVYGFEGSLDAMNELGKALKNHCGTGGSVKDGEIIIQGDHRQKIFQYLKQKGYQKARL